MRFLSAFGGVRADSLRASAEGRADKDGLAEAKRRRAYRFDLKRVRIFLKRSTESESAKLSLDWLCVGRGAQSSAKPFLYETASCRLVKKNKKRKDAKIFGISFEEIPARKLA